MSLKNKYETIVIINEKADVEEIKEGISNIIENIYCVEDFGIRKLVYSVKGNKNGHYLSFKFLGDENETITKLEKYYRNNDNVLKYITVKI